MDPHKLQQLVQQAGEREQERQATEIADAQLKVVTATFDKAAAYSNLMLLGGYAGFFGLWQLTKDYLSKSQALWSALLVLSSLAAFVIFEVVKMVVTHKGVMAQAAVLRSEAGRKNPQVLIENLNRLSAVQDRSSKRFMVFWAITVGFTVLTGFLGAGVLAYAFVVGLAK